MAPAVLQAQKPGGRKTRKRVYQNLWRAQVEKARHLRVARLGLGPKLISCLEGKLIMKRSDFVNAGAEGGRIAASRMTPKQRTERARKAARASAKARQAKARGKA
jgi:hypothetical protein